MDDLAGLDPAHVLAICTRATGRERGYAIRAVDGVLICLLPSQRAARQAERALMRVGYDVDLLSAGRGRNLVVSRWSSPGLESRLTVMREILQRFTDSPTATGRAVIRQYRDLPAESRTPEHGWELLNRARISLNGWVNARSGIHALRDTTAEPVNARTARRLRAARVLEQSIDDHVEHQMRVAGHALALFQRLDKQMDGDRAQAAAIYQASISFQRPSSRLADEFPLPAVAPSQPAKTNVVCLDSARRHTQSPRAPRLRH